MFVEMTKNEEKIIVDPFKCKRKSEKRDLKEIVEKREKIRKLRVRTQKKQSNTSWMRKKFEILINCWIVGTFPFEDQAYRFKKEKKQEERRMDGKKKKKAIESKLNRYRREGKS